MKKAFIGISIRFIMVVLISISSIIIAVVSVKTHQPCSIIVICFSLLLYFIIGLSYGLSYPTITNDTILIKWPLLPFLNKSIPIDTIKSIKLYQKRMYREHYSLLIQLRNDKAYKINDLILMPYRKVGHFIKTLESLEIEVDNQYYYAKTLKRN